MNFTRYLSASLSPQVDDICFAYLNTTNIIKRVTPLWDENRPDLKMHALNIIRFLQQYRYCINLRYCENTRTLDLYTGCAENIPHLHPIRNFLFKPFQVSLVIYNREMLRIKNAVPTHKY